MRTATPWLFVLVLIGAAPGARAEPAASQWFAAASLGVHATTVSRHHGGPDGRGPRFSLAARYAPHPVISIAAIGALSQYRDDKVYDSATRSRYALDVMDLWLGGRVLVYPVPQLWIGLGLSAIGEREGSSLSDKPDWLVTSTPELILGWKFVPQPSFGVQLESTWGRYDRFYGLEHVEFWTLGLGVEY